MRAGTLVALLTFGLVAVAWTRVSARVKPGATFGPELKPTTRRIIDAAEFAFGKFGITPTITEGYATEGHMAGSRHYSGDALDLRIWESNAAGVTVTIADELRYFLGPDYDVVIESDHIHVEYDPK